MRNAELKYTRAAANTTCRGTVALADVVMITPALSLGNTSSTRVGNSIQIKKFRVDVLSCAEPTGTANPFRVKVLIFKWKDGGNKVLTTTDMSNFYNDGAADIAGTGAWTDQTRRLSDRFDLLHESITPVMQWQSSIPTAASPQTNTKIICGDHRITFEVPYLHRTITFDDANTEPSVNVYMLATAIEISTTQVNNPATILGDVSYVLQCDYTDM